MFFSGVATSRGRRVLKNEDMWVFLLFPWDVSVIWCSLMSPCLHVIGRRLE